MVEKFPTIESMKDFEDKFLLHQYCKIEEEANPTKKQKTKRFEQKKI